MWNTKLVIVLAFCLFVPLNSPNSQWLVHGQMDEMHDAASDDTDFVLAANSNISSGSPYNNTRIMENTSGMIDDAFGALKDSFRSLFGK